jgi:hypothetical protein
MVEAGELNHPQDSGPSTEKALDSPAKSSTSTPFPQDEAGPKTAAKGPNNLEKPDRVWSAKSNLPNQ